MDFGHGKKKGSQKGSQNSFLKKRVTLSKTPLMLPKNLSILDDDDADAVVRVDCCT